MNKLQWNFNRNSNIFIQENALEHVVCEMASILSRPQQWRAILPLETESYTRQSRGHFIIKTFFPGVGIPLPTEHMT